MGRRWRLGVVACLAGLVVAGCGGGSDANQPRQAEASAPKVAKLENMLGLRAAFNDERGQPRLILLLSPT